MLPVDDVAAVQQHLKEKVAGIALEPGFRRHETKDEPPFQVDPDGAPAVRVSIANAALDSDLWRGLRSPAAVGLHPVGFREVWDFYAAHSIRDVRSDGSPNYLATPETFEEAKERFKRAVVVSALLPVAPRVFEAYAEKIMDDKDPGCHDGYRLAVGHVSEMNAKAMAKLSVALLAGNRAVVCMNLAGEIAELALPKSRSGKYHGPCNDPFPRNSIAALTGLAQFGVNRIIIRDEIGPGGKVVRMMGDARSAVVFDDRPPAADGRGGVVDLDSARLAGLRRLSDFTVADEDVVKGRFCAYNAVDAGTGRSACGLCLKYCPSGALANSSPGPDGTYSKAILNQKHRFDRGFLDFDFGHCSSWRRRMCRLYEEYACARCVAVCAARGLSGLGERAGPVPVT